MALPLLVETTGSVAALATALGIASGAKAFASVARTWIEQVSRTRRLTKALEDSKPDQRPEIIQACSRLEGSSTGYFDRDTSHSGARRPSQSTGTNAKPPAQARTSDS